MPHSRQINARRRWFVSIKRRPRRSIKLRHRHDESILHQKGFGHAGRSTAIISMNYRISFIDAELSRILKIECWPAPTLKLTFESSDNNATSSRCWPCWRRNTHYQGSVSQPQVDCRRFEDAKVADLTKMKSQMVKTVMKAMSAPSPIIADARAGGFIFLRDDCVEQIRRVVIFVSRCLSPLRQRMPRTASRHFISSRHAAANIAMNINRTAILVDIILAVMKKYRQIAAMSEFALNRPTSLDAAMGPSYRSSAAR